MSVIIRVIIARQEFIIPYDLAKMNYRLDLTGQDNDLSLFHLVGKRPYLARPIHRCFYLYVWVVVYKILLQVLLGVELHD